MNLALKSFENYKLKFVVIICLKDRQNMWVDKTQIKQLFSIYGGRMYANVTQRRGFELLKYEFIGYFAEYGQEETKDFKKLTRNTFGVKV